jgi:flagellar L-ring protein precursor FlgH
MLRFCLHGMLCLALLPAMDARATSLYTPATYQAMTSDLRMRRTGDLITVMVYETSSASSTAGTSSGRDSAVGLDVAGTGKRVAANIGTGNQMDGRGRTQREGRVLAQITVSIQKITEHGDLIVMGEQLLDINNEQQQIKVEGRIRPQDISDANVVLSTRIANAKISYTGQGDIADKQRSAWWQRLLTLFGV